MIQINFNTPKTIIVTEPVISVVTSCQIEQVIDISVEKKVIAVIAFDGGTKQLTLWEGEAYDNAGQWTDNDVEKRINELI